MGKIDAAGSPISALPYGRFVERLKPVSSMKIKLHCLFCKNHSQYLYLSFLVS